jgi:hypothetical protein
MCGECEEVDQLLGGRTWTDVAADFPHYCHDTFALLNLDAQLYYLPAYIAYELRSPGYLAGVSVESAFQRGDLPTTSLTTEQHDACRTWAETGGWVLDERLK